MQIKKSKSYLMMLLLIVSLIVGGCTNTRDQTEEFKTSTGSLTVTVYLQNIITDNSSSALAVEDQLDLSNVEVTITNTDNPNLVKTDDKDVKADASEVSFKFDNLNLNDNYDIKVKVKDDEGHYVYHGSDQALISSTAASYSVDELQFLKTKNVVVDLNNLPENVDGGTISLGTGDDVKYREEININSQAKTAQADFSSQNIAVGEYDLKISLTAKGQEKFSDSKSEILVLPNQVTKINLDCKEGQGGLGVSVLWESAPETPQNFSIQIKGDTNVKLNWNDVKAKYNIYRSQNKDFSQAIKLAEKVEDSDYIDWEVAGEQSYYYWVQAVSKTGITSDKIGPRQATIPQFSGIKLYYYSQEQMPNIVVSTETGEKVTQKMGYHKSELAKMKPTVDAPKNWYLFKIPDKYLPQSQESLVVKFGAKKKEVKLSPVETAWYDGSRWNYKPPYQVTKLQISITPKGGRHLGSQIITIEIKGANITNQKADFAGTKIDLEVPKRKIKLKNYLKAVGETGTLSVEVSKQKETIEKSFSFTRIKEEQSLETNKFTWQNTTAYYVLWDRFYNLNPRNDNSYGRPQVDDTGSQIGTFHGGDILGLTQKIKTGYFDKLGINTLVISAPYEQIHGFLGGGELGGFARYAYAGNHVLDYTMIDKNLGTVAEFRKFVTTAHKHDIRVVMDVVLNHPGENTIQDMKQYKFGTWVDKALSNDWAPTPQGSWDDYQNNIDYTSGKSKWSKWWGPNWIRDDLPGYDGGGSKQLTKNVNGQPDFKTELRTDQGLPPLLVTKWQQEKNNYEQWIIPAARQLRKDLEISPGDYLIKWLAAWVREFGIDGFRAKAVPYVSKTRWGELKGAAQQALENWRKENPQAPGADWDENFWLVGQVNKQGIVKNNYYQDNNQDQLRDFDSLVNTSFSVEQSLNSIGQTWGDYAIKINNDPHFNVLSYISSLHEGLKGITNKIDAGTKLLLAPGGVQLLYGDEINRRPPDDLTPQQAAKADYPWRKQQAKVLKHWQKLGQFRKKHPAVGAGQQIELAPNTYGRMWDKNNDGAIEDQVVIKINVQGTTKVKVADIFKEGTKVHNFYTGKTAVVKQGRVKVEAVNGVVLLEKFYEDSIE